MAEMDRKTTPYAYAFDDPIRHTDPDGMFGEDVNESYDQDGPGKGIKVAAGIAITTNPGLGGIIFDALGGGVFRGAQFGLSATGGAVLGTIGLVLLPTETGGGADKTKLPPELIAAPLLLAKSKKRRNLLNPVLQKEAQQASLTNPLQVKELFLLLREINKEFPQLRKRQKKEKLTTISAQIVAM